MFVAWFGSAFLFGCFVFFTTVLVLTGIGASICVQTSKVVRPLKKASKVESAGIILRLISAIAFLSDIFFIILTLISKS